MMFLVNVNSAVRFYSEIGFGYRLTENSRAFLIVEPHHYQRFRVERSGGDDSLLFCCVNISNHRKDQNLAQQQLQQHQMQQQQRIFSFVLKFNLFKFSFEI